jgi:FeS assembly SUF system protein
MNQMTNITNPGPSVAQHGDEAMLEAIIAQIRTIYDPEIPVNIHDLGLIYAIDITGENSVLIRMTLTAPACPVAGTMPGMVEEAVKAIPDVTDCTVELVWDPPWNREMISDEAKLELGIL